MNLRSLVLVLIVGAALAGGLPSHPAAAALVTVSSHDLWTYAHQVGPGFAQSHDTLTTLNRTNTYTEVSGPSQSTASLNWQADAGNTYALLEYSFDQARGGEYASAAGNRGDVTFTANFNTTYVLSGEFAATGSQSVRNWGFLQDVTTLTYLSQDHNWSFHTPNEHFIYGDAVGGDYQAITSGSLTGNLIANHTYRLAFEGSIKSEATGLDTGATATGSFRLALGDVPSAVTTVPEPTTLAIWSLLGGIGLVVGHRRRRRKAA